MATSKTKIQKSDNDSDNFLNVVMFRYFPYWPLFILLIAIIFCESRELRGYWILDGGYGMVDGGYGMLDT